MLQQLCYNLASVILLLLAGSLTIKRRRLILLTCCLAHLSVCVSVSWSVSLSVWKVYCGNTTEWI